MTPFAPSLRVTIPVHRVQRLDDRNGSRCSLHMHTLRILLDKVLKLIQALYLQPAFNALNAMHCTPVT